MNKQKAKNMLGLAMRAGKIISGEELVLRDIRQQKVPLVFVASDASQNTQKKSKIKVNSIMRQYWIVSRRMRSFSRLENQGWSWAW